MPLPSDATELVKMAPILSALVALLAILFAFRFRREPSRAEQMKNISELFIKEYLDRAFPHPITIGQASVTTLKDARCLARAAVAPKNGETAGESRKNFLSHTLDQSSWENKFAYELSLALEGVGAAVFAGALPLDFVLAVNADQIVEDWSYAEAFVNSENLRRRPDAPIPRRSSLQAVVFYHRRHAEWLVYVAGLWLSRNWISGQEKRMAIDLSVPTIRCRERAIRQMDKSLLASSTKSTLRRLIGRGWPIRML
jgi:hypothetical protein